jgi:hypothetical protein
VSRPNQADLALLIEALTGAGVEFIVVGGAAAILHGASTTTLDLDIVHSRSDDNLDRLLEVLNNINAIYRDLSGRQIEPTREALAGTGQLNLITDLGPLDPLCVLHDGRGFDELVHNTVLMRDGEITIRVLDLPTLIEVKAKAGRAKDRAVLAQLGALLDEPDET